MDVFEQLHCLADASAIDLYQLDGASKSNVDEVFAFDRTVSRLLEVRVWSRQCELMLWYCFIDIRELFD